MDNEKGLSYRTNLLTTIDFIETEMIDNEVIYYHPAAFRHYSMIQSLPLRGFKCLFTIYYANGSEENIYLDMEEHASISIKFVKK